MYIISCTHHKYCTMIRDRKPSIPRIYMKPTAYDGTSTSGTQQPHDTPPQLAHELYILCLLSLQSVIVILSSAVNMTFVGFICQFQASRWLQCSPIITEYIFFVIRTIDTLQFAHKDDAFEVWIYQRNCILFLEGQLTLHQIIIQLLLVLIPFYIIFHKRQYKDTDSNSWGQHGAHLGPVGPR